MISNEQVPKVKTKRLMRRFAPRERQSIYDAWQASGLSKSKFCRQNQVPISTFSKWCQDYERDKDQSLPGYHWNPVVPKDKVVAAQGPMVITIQMSDSTRTCIFLLFLILLFTEIFHAINALW